MERIRNGIMAQSNDLFGRSERWLDAELALSEKKEDRFAALEAHVARTREVERIAFARARAGAGTEADTHAAAYERYNAEIRYFEATGKAPPPAPELELKKMPRGRPGKIDAAEKSPGDQLEPPTPKKKKGVELTNSGRKK